MRGVPGRNKTAFTREECNKWRNTPFINPRTNRRIIEDGPVFKKLKHDCGANIKRKEVQKMINIPDEEFNQEECKKWRSLPHINPRTNRMLEPDGVISQQLERDCGGRKAMVQAVKQELAKVDVAEWNICMSGEHSEFRDKLHDVNKIGKGSFGEVYSVNLGKINFTVKEAYLESKEKMLLKEGVGRKVKIGEIPKHSYPDEYKILSLVQNLLPVVPNFIYIYGVSVCDGCRIANEGIGTCYLTFMETAASDLTALDRAGMSPATQRSILYQLLIAVEAIHSTYGIYHRDIKLANVLFKPVPAGGYVKYDIRGETFYVENTGILALLSDFGVADVLLPAYSINKRYGHRHAMVIKDKDGNKRFKPITCKYSVGGTIHEPVLIPANRVKWTNSNGNNIYGTSNNFFGELNIQPNTPVNLNDPIKFPPFEFFYDIQDVVRMFIGGKRTSGQPGYHTKINGLDATLNEELSRNCYKETFSCKTTDVKFVVALEMLKSIYVAPDNPKLSFAFR